MNMNKVNQGSIEYSMEISGDSPCEITLKILIKEENKGGYKENTGTGN
jgi:hypothetical protein